MCTVENIAMFVCTQRCLARFTAGRGGSSWATDCTLARRRPRPTDRGGDRQLGASSGPVLRLVPAGLSRPAVAPTAFRLRRSIVRATLVIAGVAVIAAAHVLGAAAL
jgi:hypothetical protein